ncbi:hypothetical protein RhiirB3_378982 [Rhizophagus irregularis]|nr:hypothetical protein RhiirB3_378982 [Rhizophagus irregularis]
MIWQTLKTTFFNRQIYNIDEVYMRIKSTFLRRNWIMLRQCLGILDSTNPRRIRDLSLWRFRFLKDGTLLISLSLFYRRIEMMGLCIAKIMIYIMSQFLESRFRSKKCDTGGIKEEREEETVIIGDVVNQIKPCTNCTIGHRPELGEHRWYSLKALIDWADDLDRCKKFHSLTRESDNERNTEEEEKNTDDVRSSDK